MSLEKNNLDFSGHGKASVIRIKSDLELFEKPIDSQYSQLGTIQSSEILEDSHLSVYNRVDESAFDVDSPTKSKLSCNSSSIKEFKTLQYNNDFYEGTVLLNNLHGHGFFTTQKNGQKIFYDGLFYANRLEGYSQVFYENGTHFQGLFKQHKRYGPGVFTYANGTQDVGFWNGSRLVRLACIVGSSTVPSLVSSTLGKTKLLSYRYLVPLCEEDNNSAEEIFRKIGSNIDVLNQSDEVLNLTIRNPNSLFFNKKFYDYHFFGGKDCTIKVAVDEGDDDLSSEELNVAQSYPRQRIENLQAKIKEADENLQPFLAIKESLLEHIRYCKVCCTEKESTHILKAEEVSEDSISRSTFPTIPSAKDTDTIVLDLSSVVPDLSLYDASLSSIGLQNSLPDKSLTHEESPVASKQKIFEYCPCGEHEIDNLQNLEEQLSNITKQENYYRNIKDNLQKKLDKLLDQEIKNQENPKPRYKLLEVTEVWAWNNEEFLRQIQKHCFKHRHSENMVNFSVPDLIFGNRKDFQENGDYEKMCHKFLIACSNGKKDFVRQCLRENINPNLCDAKGNTGIFFAIAADQAEIISILTTFGAKLDQINDEGLTPLSLCILKYITQKRRCKSWEKAFLPETEIPNIPNLPKWYEVKSFLSMASISSKQSLSIDQQDSQNEYSNSRIMELFHRFSNLWQDNSFIQNIPNASYVFDLSYKKAESTEEPFEDLENEMFQNELKKTHLTIMTLLEYGANPNITSVPYPPLVLSLYTENLDLVRQILEAKADINICVTDDNLSCLHIITSLNISETNVLICRLLLVNQCNPNLKTLPSHWQECKSYFTGNIPQNFKIEDMGKNALHIVCMRRDFENDVSNNFGLMCKTLIKGGIHYQETYLGHTALSLAVLVGNIRLFQCLIKLNIFNPYEPLEYEMGNILTLFTLKRFENLLPTEKCKAILNALFEVDVNVLNMVGDAENAIVFAEKGDAIFNSKSVVMNGGKSGKNKAKIISKPKKSDKNSQSVIMTEFIRSLGRETIIKQVQMVATEVIYEFIEEGILDDKDIAIALAEFLTPHIAINNLEYLFHSEKIDFERFKLDNVEKFLHFVNLHKKIVKTKKKTEGSKNSKGKKEKEKHEGAATNLDMNELIANANFKKSTFVPHKKHACYISKPGLDNPDIYKICFHCLKGQNKELKLCPRCQMIRFCSTHCNKLNLKLKGLHTCNLLFYDMTEEEREEITKGECLSELAEQVKQNCLKILHQKRESQLLLQEEKLLEMWRADTYGTKFMQFKPLLHQAAARTRGLSWNLSGLQKLLEKNFRRNPADCDSYNIDLLLSKLSNRQKIQEGGSRKSARSSLGYGLASKLGSMIAEHLEEKKQDTQACKCSEKIKHAKHKRRDKSGRHRKHDSVQNKQLEILKGQYLKDSFSGKLESPNVVGDAGAVVKKLKKVPEKYQKFIEVMGTHFPDIDVTTWLLPYACYSNGQLFYKFCDNEIFRQSYSFT